MARAQSAVTNGCSGALLLGALVPATARAAPEERPAVAVVASESNTPFEVVDALRLELDQAGYEVVDDPLTRTAATVFVSVDEDGWRLDVHEHRRDVQLHAEGIEADMPTTLGLIAVELLVESTVELPAPEPAPAAVELESTVGVTSVETPALLYAAGPRGTDRRPSRWTMEAGVAGASVGPLGVAVGMRHRWSRAELGLGVEGGVLTGFTEVATATSMMTISGGGFLRGRFGAAYVFRPGSRVRPHVGGATELVLPLVRSRFVAVQADENVLVEGLEYGLALVPEAEVGVSIAFRSGVALALATRAGPVFELAELPLADGSTYGLRPWFVAGTAALRFGLGRGASVR